MTTPDDNQMVVKIVVKAWHVPLPQSLVNRRIPSFSHGAGVKGFPRNAQAADPVRFGYRAGAVT